MTGPRLAVIVPTRNRPELAAAAVRSLTVQLAGLPVDVWVSDNSTDDTSCEALARAVNGDARLLRPPEPLPMVRHWQWALDQTLGDPAATHVAVLTDRMLVRPGELTRLVRIMEALPDRVVSWEIDAVLDYDERVRVHLNPWTGNVRRVGSEPMLTAAASSRPSAVLPRMLNSITPRRVLDEITARYGSVFASIAPDYCFAFRCLTVVDSVAHYDRSAFVHRASRLSNGANQARGTHSDASQLFTAELDRPLNAHAPVPALRGVLNAIVNEYCFVREHDGADLPPVVMADYLAAVDRDLDNVRDPVLLREQWALLADLGHRHVPYEQWLRAQRRAVAGRPTDAAGRILARLLGPPASRQLWQRLAVAPPSAEWFGWQEPAAAVTFAATVGRRRRRSGGGPPPLLTWAQVNGRP